LAKIRIAKKIPDHAYGFAAALARVLSEEGGKTGGEDAAKRTTVVRELG
jgi:hypothetical protein